MRSRRWWTGLFLLGGLLAAIAGTVLAVAVNVATDDQRPWLGVFKEHPVWWVAASTAAVACAGWLMWWAQRGGGRASAELRPARVDVDAAIVARPAELEKLVSSLLVRGTGGVTTVALGAGGFGKSTLAQMVCTDRRIVRRFGGRVYWVTLGRDVRTGAAIAMKVNNLLARIDQSRPVAFTDAQQAGDHLAALLAAGPPRLLVLDDVWFPEQLAAFPADGRCARLITTRVRPLVTGAAVTVDVGHTSEAEAEAVLTRGLPALPSPVVADLLSVTWCWPLLMRIVNSVLADQHRVTSDLAAAAQDLVASLRHSGPLRVDHLSGAASRYVDVDDPKQRQRAVAATIEASIGLLTPDEQARFGELLVFAGDELIPAALAVDLWMATAGFDRLQGRALCARLAALALVTIDESTPDSAIEIHDVIRDYLHLKLSAARVGELHRLLLDTAAAALPEHDERATLWWRMDPSSRYLWDHLVGHLLAAGRSDEAQALATDLRWVVARLERSGPAAPHADLALVGTATSDRFGHLLAQTAHLLAPTRPQHSQVDILLSRVAHDPKWGPQAEELGQERTKHRFVNRATLPDLPHPALSRVLRGDVIFHAVTVAPDGSWLAAGDDHGKVHIWHFATGVQLAMFDSSSGWIGDIALTADGRRLLVSGHDPTVRAWDVASWTELPGIADPDAAPVRCLAVPAEADWLATAGYDPAIRIWDRIKGELRTTLHGHTGDVNALAAAPDGSWLASAGTDGTMRIWDIETGSTRAELSAPSEVRALAVASDGKWIASGGVDGTVTIWDPASRTQRANLAGHSAAVSAVAIARDGSWLASGSNDGTVRIWAVATGSERVVLLGHGFGVRAVAIAPSGTWLATCGGDKAVRIWDLRGDLPPAPRPASSDYLTTVAVAPDGTWFATDGNEGSVQVFDTAGIAARDPLHVKVGRVSALRVSPDGTWLAAAGSQREVGIYDLATGKERASFTGHVNGGVKSIAIAPDSSWVATGGSDQSIHLWSPYTGEERAILEGHQGWVSALAVTPDGALLASAAADGTVRLWDVGTAEQRLTVSAGSAWLTALAVSPDGTWVAAAGSDNIVRIWDTAHGVLLAKLTGHTDWVESLAASPDAALLVSTARDHTLRLWGVRTGTAEALMRVEDRLEDCAWIPGTRSIVVAGTRGLYAFTVQ